MSTWVIKVGSSLLTKNGKELDDAFITALADEVAALVSQQHRVALVTSGAIAAGRVALNFVPESLGELQAAAAVGQTGLMQVFSACFAKKNLTIGQILLTHDDIKERRRYLNARTTLNTLFSLGVVPVINENDTVSTEEIRLGNNDIIGGLIANLIDAEKLVILTDTQGLYTADPNHNPDSRLITQHPCSDPYLDSIAGGSRSNVGSGGMLTKVHSARLAARSGTDTWIVSGAPPTTIGQIARGESSGTHLVADGRSVGSRLRWLAGRQKVEGTLVLDHGAVEALVIRKKSLLPVGVIKVHGIFERGALVAVKGPNGAVVAQGLTNYDSQQVEAIRGKNSNAIRQMLGYPHDHELIHRDNLVLSQ